MKPVASTMTEVDNLPGEEVKFSISPANSAWVMRSMADLYSNRELACIREYSTNAYDSNKEKAIRDGHDIKPIEVSLPNAMNPYFLVKDSGVGMSERELKEVYTQFGESTKRDSDEFNGMLGFGSKSAIAYTNTFTVTSVKDGHKTVGVVTRREDSMGGYLVTLKIVLSVPTNEPSGVAIQIPVHNWREFEQKGMDFYRFWLPGTVLVNGKQPEWAVGEKIDDGLFYYPNNSGQNLSYVVMGNVPYRIINSDALFPRGMNKISFVAYVPLGTVEFTPSREDLKYSEHTKNNLRKIITDFVDSSVAKAKADIAAANTHSEAYLAWSKWRKVIGVNQVEDLTFKGDKLVDDFSIQASRYDMNSYRGTAYTIRGWSLSDMERTIIITNFDVILNSAQKKKIKDWVALKKYSANYILLTRDADVKNVWVDQDRVIDWATVKAELPKAPKKPRVVNTAWGRKAGTFDLITRKGRLVEKDVPSAKPLYYISVQEYNLTKNLNEVLDCFDMDAEVVLVPANRMGKFLRFYPHAENIRPHLQSQVVLDGPSLIPKDGITFLSADANDRTILEALDTTRILDPEVVEMCKIFKQSEDFYLKDYIKHYKLANMLGIGNKFAKHQYAYYWQRKNRPITSKYPLASGYLRSDINLKKHVIIYMNAVYTARKDGKNV